MNMYLIFLTYCIVRLKSYKKRVLHKRRGEQKMQDPYGIRVNITNRMSLKMNCTISQRRCSQDSVLDIFSNNELPKVELILITFYLKFDV